MLGFVKSRASMSRRGFRGSGVLGFGNVQGLHDLNAVQGSGVWGFGFFWGGGVWGWGVSGFRVQTLILEPLKTGFANRGSTEK